MAARPTSTGRFCDALFQDASAEFRLLAACCCWPPAAAEHRVSKLLSSGTIDWQALLGLGQRHRVDGFLANALRLQKNVPAEVSDVLKARAERIERENLLHVAVSVQVVRRFESEGIPAVILKGAPLSRLVFGNIGVRHSKDIDILVDGGQLELAERSLRQSGFRPASALAEALTDQQTQAFRRYRKHLDFVHTATGCHLELHWKAFDNARMGAISLTEREWIECSPGVKLPMPKREDLFPLLCAHGASHAWFRLKWLVDVAAMLAQGTAEEAAGLLKAANARGLDRPAEQALLLCASLSGDPRIPPPPRSSVAGRWLAKMAHDAMLQTIDAGSSEAAFVPKRLAVSKLLLRRSWRYRMEELRVNAVAPADWKTLRLPSWLHFAYPAIRVPLWLWRRWSGERFKQPS